MARGMIATDLFHMQWVSDARLSPDGRLVAFTVTHLDKEADDYRAAIWLGPTDGSTPPRRFSGGAGKDSALRWAPDGTRLAFVSARHHNRDHDHAEGIFVVNTAGGEPVRLTPGGGACALPAWSPDGQAMAIWATLMPRTHPATVVCGWSQQLAARLVV
jgi:Tol biopolymer transport system component